MGQTEVNSSLRQVTSLSKQSFNFKELIGSGGFSKVYKAFYPRVYHALAIKEMSKQQIIERNFKTSIYTERNILSTLFHPFIINIYAAFQDQDNLYLVMDYCSCGDLRYQMSYIKTYPEKQLQFIAGCVILGLEYIHSKGIIHKDIKPENLICDDKGYYRISDFGIASKLSDSNSIKYDLLGTPGYIAPEIIRGEKVGYESDYFSLGVLLYELIYDDIPIKSTDKETMINEFSVMNKIKLKNFKQFGYSNEFYDFLNGLLEIDNNKRLGKGGISELKSHPFFNEFNWKQLFQKTKPVPMIPKLFSKQYYNNQKNSNNDEMISCKNTSDTEHPSNGDRYENAFNEYNFLRKAKINYQQSFNHNNNNQNKLNRKNSLVTPIKQNEDHSNANTVIKSPKIKLFSQNSMMNVFASSRQSKRNINKKDSSPFLPKLSFNLPSINQYNNKPKSRSGSYCKLKPINKSVSSRKNLLQASQDEIKNKSSIHDVMQNGCANNKKGKGNLFNQYMKLQNNKSRSKYLLQNSINKISLSSLMME